MKTASETVLEAVKEGAEDYFAKPFKVQETIIVLAVKAFNRALLVNVNRAR